MTTAPTEITVCDLEVVVMPNGEVICAGRTVGWVKALGPYVRPRAPAEALLASMDEWLGNSEGLMIEDVVQWRDQLAAALGKEPVRPPGTV